MKKKSRKLTLHRETLHQLTDKALERHEVVGGTSKNDSCDPMCWTVNICTEATNCHC